MKQKNMAIRHISIEYIQSIGRESVTAIQS